MDAVSAEPYQPNGNGAAALNSGCCWRFVLLGVARLLVLSVPFRWLARVWGSICGSRPKKLLQLRWRWLCGGPGRAIGCQQHPWQSVCLPQAITGQWMLKRRRIAATLYLGVMKAEHKPEQLAAHAWLRCGSRILTGAAGHRQYTVVSTFS